LEEKLGQLQKKKLILQNRLAAEKKCIEQLRVKILQMQEREEDLCSQISRLESLLQNYEQRNFELEESCIEMKCSVQFVIHSIPIFALCYFGALLRSAHGRSSSVLNILLSLPATVGVNIGRYLHVTNNSNALPFVPDVFVSPVPPTRKHKLRELSSPTVSEEVEPKLKKLRRMLDKNGITCLCSCANCGNGRLSITDDDGSREQALMTQNHAEVQTGEELWKLLVEQIFAEQKGEWQKTEKVLLKKIEVLECDIDKCQEIFDRERGSLIKIYEHKLAEKESQLRETQACRNEKRDLQEKWNCLIQELEQFALYLGKNLSERSEEQQQEQQYDEDEGNTLSSSAATTMVVSGKDDTLFVRAPTQLEVTANPATGTISPFAEVEDVDIESNEQRMPRFISSSIIKSLRDTSANDAALTVSGNDEGHGQDTEVLQKTRIIYYLQSSLKEHLSTFEKREKHLLDQIDQLTQEIRQHSQQDSQHEGDMIAYLSQENERLVSLFQDHEKVWGDLQQLQEEHEKLKLEVGNIVTIRKKLEDSQKVEAEMRDRLEELERTESHLKSQISQLEKKEAKALEKIQQLRDEIQFLRTKCCQLQDDIDSRVTREAKYKNELQALTVKLKESSLELEEKESQLESNETALQAQIQKLKNQLTELHQAYADTECSNGMLREEVSYLERTVEEAIAKAVQSENTVTALSHELKQKDLTIEELQRKLQQLTTHDPIASNVLSTSSSALNPNDLADFNKHDGGLLGVARDVEEVVTLLQGQCIDGDTVIYLNDVVVESDNTKLSNKEEGGEEEDLMIANLQEMMTNLGSQIRNLEDAFYIRQKELRDSYMTETSWWKMRCEEKNKLIELLGRRIAQLCVTDIHGYFLDGILREIEKVRASIGTCHLLTAHKESRELSRNRDSSSCSPLSTSSASSSTTMITCSPSPPARQSWCPVEPPPRKRTSKKSKASSISVTTANPNHPTKPILPSDFTCDSLCSYLVAERKRVMAILEDALGENTVIDDKEGSGANTSGESSSTALTFSSVGTAMESSTTGLEFRVLRKIGEDSLLVSWSMPENHLLPTNVSGYEIAVNGKVFLRIPQPNRHKVILFGLNLDEPLHLTLRCSGDEGLEESTITYIN
ncbi:Structural maintenance of chromosomes protein 2, partial [Orchesella cincta]